MATPQLLCFLEIDHVSARRINTIFYNTNDDTLVEVFDELHEGVVGASDSLIKAMFYSPEALKSS